MSNITFSVILPVYNAGNYLQPCLDSLVKQAGSDVEILVVDDGSTDGSGVLADGYAGDVVKVFHIENGGVSHARNFGLDRAQGTYVSFVDADDFVVEGYFEALRRCIRIPSDWYVFAHYNYKNGSSEYYSAGVKASLPELRRRLFSLELSAPWDKLFVREKIGSLRFDESMTRYEDLAFVMDYFARIESVYVSKQAVYCYRLNEQSTCAKPKFSHLESCNAIYEKLKALGGGDLHATRRALLFAVTLIAVRMYRLGTPKRALNEALRSLPLFSALQRDSYAGLPDKVRKLCLKFGWYGIAAHFFWY